MLYIFLAIQSLVQSYSSARINISENMVSADSMPSDTGKNKSTKNGANSVTVMSGYSDNGVDLSVDQSSKKSKLSNLKGTGIVYFLLR